jgi:hypothetical protein
MRSSPRNLVLFCAAFYLFLVAVLFVAIRMKNGGHFVYALDDPYIHLALAENLAHGHYGINTGEFSSPSSSVLWPFLLIPFAGTRVHVYLPLLWNLIFGVTAACLIGSAISKWPPQVDEQRRMSMWKQMITAVLLIMVANLVSLTLVGMEHVLQVLIAICCAIGVMEVLSGRKIPSWCLAAAVIGPMVRYEDLALTVAVCFALAGLGSWRKSGVVLGCSVAPLIMFTVFLKSKGLPLLPMSVMVKGGVYANASFAMKLYKMIRSSGYQDLTDPERWPILLFLLIFLSLAWKEQTRVRRFVFAGASLVAALQLAIGRFGWFYRYEVYALIFLTMLCMWVLGERPRFLFGYFAMGLVFCAGPFIQATQTTVLASHDIYSQQYQMHRFITDFYHGDYAVNDLGLVSFQKPAGRYVLDLYGLGSGEASRQTEKTPEWMEQMVQKRGIKLAMLFPEWFEIPLSWTPVGKMCLPQTPVVLPEPCMVFYSTSEDATAEIREDLKRFAPTLPNKGEFWFDPERREGGYAMPEPMQEQR